MHDDVTVRVLLHAKKTNSVCPFLEFYWQSVCKPPTFLKNVFTEISCFFLLLTELNPCIGVLFLCLGQHRRWLGTMVKVNIQFVWPCCALWLELSGPCGWFPLVLQETLLLVPPLEIWKSLLFTPTPPETLELVYVVGVVLWGNNFSSEQ